MSNKLSSEEKELLQSIEKNEWKSMENLEAEKQRYQEYASHAMKKEKRVNIRMSEHDLDSIQRIANEEGLPYQTLISSVLHKYINGRLIDIKNLEHLQKNAG